MSCNFLGNLNQNKISRLIDQLGQGQEKELRGLKNENYKEIQAKLLKAQSYKHLKMVSLIVAGTLLVFIWTIENDKTSNISALVFGITLTYFYRYSIHKNFSSQQLITYVLYGQNLYILLYLAWLSFFHKSTYVFYVPLYLSSVSKIIWLFTSKDQLNFEFLEQISLFQTKTQIFVLGYLIVSIIYGGSSVLLQIFFLIIIIKFKYSFHQKAQEAFKELHFVVDNILKRTKLRSKYQRFVQILGLIGQVYGGSKDIIY